MLLRSQDSRLCYWVTLDLTWVSLDGDWPGGERDSVQMSQTNMG